MASSSRICRFVAWSRSAEYSVANCIDEASRQSKDLVVTGKTRKAAPFVPLRMDANTERQLKSLARRFLPFVYAVLVDSP
jgi:hypothetical protein